jgi:hypothetical protein
MLRDILNPFQQFVARARRPSHPVAGGSAEGTAPRRVVIPVRVPLKHADAGGSVASHQPPNEEHLAARVQIGPGPGEVIPPKWWQNHEVSSTRRDASS